MTREEQNALAKKLFFLTKKYANNDLFDFFINKDHRLIHKWVNYFPVYEKWFKKFRNTDVVFVEVGVSQGGSLQMWKEYFGKKATIIGVDINKRCKNLEEDQITVEIGSQEDVNFWEEFKTKYPRVDVFLDDGGHTMNQQIVTFQQMFPHVQNNGIYMCEDCHTSYWEKYGGGLNHPDTFIEFSKKIIDMLNATVSKGALQPNYFTESIDGIHFYKSMVIFEKFDQQVENLSCKFGTPSF